MNIFFEIERKEIDFMKLPFEGPQEKKRAQEDEKQRPWEKFNGKIIHARTREGGLKGTSSNPSSTF